MLKFFRNASQSLFIKILFGGIIFSFCLWGVGDIIKNYSASKAVLNIANTKITVEQFTREYNKDKQKIRNSGSKSLTDKEMEMIDIKEIVLDRLIQKAVLDKTLNKLDIVVPKKSLLNMIQALPEFQINGVFDEKIYETALRRSGINEAEFLGQIRDNIARTQLFHPIIVGYKIPNFIKNIMAKDFESKNTLLISKIKVDDVKYDEVPSNDELTQYYDNNKDKYKKPETRNISILVIDYKNLTKDFEIDENEVNEYYKSNKESYKSKEKRSFERFIFEEKEDADKAWNMMNKGTDSNKIVKNFMPKIDNIKNIEISDFPVSIGKELFDLKLQKASSVYSISGKFYIYRLTNIEKPKEKSETEIKNEIREALQNDKMNSPEFYSKIKDIKNKIDDGFGSGKSIEEVSKETGMKFVDLNNFEKAIDNKELVEIVKDEDTRTEIVDSIFSIDELQASHTIDSKETDGISYVAFVRSVKKSEVPDLEKIKDTVNKDYILSKKDKIATEKINEILNKKLEAAQELNKSKNTKKFKLTKRDLMSYKDDNNTEVKKVLDEIPNINIVLNIVSTLKKGEAKHYKISDKEYVIFAIENIEKIENSSKEFENIVSRYIDKGASDDVITVSMDAFKKQFNIKIDHKLIDKITKSTDDQEENS